MKKTLILTHEYFPFAGGVAKYCYNLFKNFPTDKYLVLTDCPEIKTSGNIIKLKFLRPYVWPHWLLAMYSIWRIVKKHKIKIIFTPNILPLGSMAYVIKKIFGLPYIISLHGLDINLALKNKPGLSKKILSQAQSIICNTKYTANLITGLVPDQKVHIIYPSAEMTSQLVAQEKIDELKKKYQISDEKVILTVARLVERKGHALLIKTLASLSDLKLKYFIIGDGPEKDSLTKQIKERGLEDKVFLLGQIYNDELPAWYQLADIFALPHQALGADVEGFGIVFLEAASYHLPIIAGASGGVKEMFTGQGDAFFVEDEQSLALALRDLVGDEQKRISFGERAYLRSEYFKKIAVENIKLFEKILS